VGVLGVGKIDEIRIQGAEWEAKNNVVRCDR
jgi:hypothetical protein